MKNSRASRVLGIMVVVFSLVFLVSGCGWGKTAVVDTTKDSANSSKPDDLANNPIFDLYNRVEINAKKSDVEKLVGATGNTDPDGSYVYLDEETGYAVNVFYSESDLVTLKVLIPTTGSRELIEVSNAEVAADQVAEIKQGMTLANVKNLLNGEGIEMLRMVYPGSADKEAYGLAWINNDGSILVVTFDADTNTVLAAEFKDSLL